MKIIKEIQKMKIKKETKEKKKIQMMKKMLKIIFIKMKMEIQSILKIQLIMKIFKILPCQKIYRKLTIKVNQLSSLNYFKDFKNSKMINLKMLMIKIKKIIIKHNNSIKEIKLMDMQLVAQIKLFKMEKKKEKLISKKNLT